MTTSPTYDMQTQRLVITHGGVEGEQHRVAVLNQDGVVTTTVLVPADWPDQDPTTRWQPDGQAVTLTDEQRPIGPGWRREANRWIPPEPPADPGPREASDGDIAYGTVDEAGPPVLVTLDKTGEQVTAGRLAGYTPEKTHKVKLTRISGQWVVEDRVLLADT